MLPALPVLPILPVLPVLLVLPVLPVLLVLGDGAAFMRASRAVPPPGRQLQTISAAAGQQCHCVTNSNETCNAGSLHCLSVSRSPAYTSSPQHKQTPAGFLSPPNRSTQTEIHDTMVVNAGLGYTSSVCNLEVEWRCRYSQCGTI